MKYSILIIAIFLIAIVFSAFVIVQKKDTEVMVVNITLAKPIDDDPVKIISQVEASTSYLNRMEILEDTPLYTPGITVLVLQDKKEISGWNSISLPQSSSIYGKFSLTVKLTDTVDKNRPVRILTRVVGPAGTEISVKMTDVMVS